MYNKRPFQKKKNKGGNAAGGARNVQPPAQVQQPAQALTIRTSRVVQAPKTKRQGVAATQLQPATVSNWIEGSMVFIVTPRIKTPSDSKQFCFSLLNFIQNNKNMSGHFGSFSSFIACAIKMLLLSQINRHLFPLYDK